MCVYAQGPVYVWVSGLVVEYELKLIYFYESTSPSNFLLSTVVSHSIWGFRRFV